MILPAITPFTANIGGLSFLLTIALIAHALFPHSPASPKQVELSRWSLALRFVLEMAGICVWPSVWLPLFAWGMFIGDQDHWFYHYAWIFVTVFSIVVMMIATVRISNRGATTLYLWIHLLTPILLLSTFAAATIHEQTKGILAETAEEASQKIFAEMAPKFDEPVTLVANTHDLPSDLTADGRRVYWIMGVKEPRARFSVIPHRRYGWQRADWAGIPPSDKELARAKDWLTSNKAGAIAVLKRVVLNYPNTPAQAEARELLKSIELPPK